MSGFSIFGRRNIDEDWVDRLNGHWTVLLISAMSAGAFLARFMFSAISCVMPAHVTAFFALYAHHVCLHKEIYYMTWEMQVIDPTIIIVSWHMWFPLILFLQAFVFKAPRIIWDLLKQSLMVNMNETAATLANCQTLNPEKRQFLFRDAALLISKSATNGCVVGLLYIFVKFLMCLNLLAQFVFLTLVVKDKIGINPNANETHSNWTIVPTFPKTVLCDFNIRSLQNIRSYTLQCELGINYQFEQCYVFLWFWVFAVFLISSVNFLLWIVYLFIPCVKESRITAYVNAFNSGPGTGAGLAKTFISNFLGIDGVFLITMISRNSSELVAADLTRHLFQIYQETHTGRIIQPQQTEMSTSAQTRQFPASYPVQTERVAHAPAPPGERRETAENVPLETFRQEPQSEVHQPLMAKGYNM